MDTRQDDAQMLDHAASGVNDAFTVHPLMLEAVKTVSTAEFCLCGWTDGGGGGGGGAVGGGVSLPFEIRTPLLLERSQTLQSIFSRYHLWKEVIRIFDVIQKTWKTHSKNVTH